MVEKQIAAGLAICSPAGREVKRFVLWLVFVFVIALIPSTALFASPAVKIQKSEIISVGNWTVTCAEAGDPSAKWRCSAILRLAQKKNNARRVVFSWIVGRRKGKLVSVFSMPSGVRIEPGVRVLIDGKPFEQARFTVCLPNLCEAVLAMDRTATQILSKAATVDVLVTAANGKDVTFKIKNAGFGEALKHVSK